jgi:hypothetical protein
LRTIHGAGSVFHLYWRNEGAPVLQAGFCPPLAEGFHRFVHARPIEKAIGEQLAEELKSGKADPYDTHPPLRERIAAFCREIGIRLHRFPRKSCAPVSARV